MKNFSHWLRPGVWTISLAVVLGAGTVACTGDMGADGAEGPAGPMGSAGPTGPQGSGVVTAPLPAGAVYTMSDDATANQVFAFQRATDGTLVPLDVYATGGRGAANLKGTDQGSLAYSATKQLLFAVNAGDNSLTTFEMHADGTLALLSIVDSGGIDPISVTASGDYVYVVNAGSTTPEVAANIAGFQIQSGGLTAVTGSTQALSAANPGPAEISFNGDGSLLVVTEKGTNKIDTYVVTGGVAGAANVQASSGATPFGFAFSAGGELVVSEAGGGPNGTSATSSYTASSAGVLTAISNSVPSSQTAACWLIVVGMQAVVANAHSNDLSMYAIAADGALTLSGSGSSATTGAAPLDMAATAGGDFLYVIDAGAASLSSYAIAADGSLTKQPDFAGLPATAVGLVAR
ncbi:MAG TPA: beta-propeller fold lactonase family protein [Kofleriaceae bacterium]|jgi:6-phosphogluconolactonase (cycloisomerase 2 family)